MGGFTIVTNEGVVVDTDCGETVLGEGAAVGTGGITSLTGEGFYSLFGVGWHGLLLVCCLY